MSFKASSKGRGNCLSLGAAFLTKIVYFRSVLTFSYTSGVKIWYALSECVALKRLSSTAFVGIRMTSQSFVSSSPGEVWEHSNTSLTL